MIRGELVGVQGRRITVRATVRAEAEPDVVLTEGEAQFVLLREDQMTSMFGSRAEPARALRRLPASD